jgi:hypothetical protein
MPKIGQDCRSFLQGQEAEIPQLRRRQAAISAGIGGIKCQK